ncbi:zinc finger CCCH domain-containing protein 6-like isoform X2 [Aristolochia californica]
MLHSMGAGTEEHSPPGFEAPQQSTPRIPTIKWSFPPKLLLNSAWQVVAGEESKEVEAQNQREMRVLEAVYPRPSAIPPNPSVSPDALSYQLDEVHTPLVPITPVEDEELVDQSDLSPSIGLFETSELQSFSKSFPDMSNLHPSRDSRSGMPEKSHDTIRPLTCSPLDTEKSIVEISSAAEPDVVAAATAAFTAIMRTNEAGSLIDRDLLIKILSNPQLIDHLVKDYGTPATCTQMTTNPVSNPVTASVTMPVPSQIVHSNLLESSAASTPLPSSTFTQPAVSGHFHSLTSTVAPALPMDPQSAVTPLTSTSTLSTTPVVKDINYYKSLIQQHGEERPEAQNPTLPQRGKRQSYHNLGLNMETIQQQNPKARDSRGKIQKPCIYFNTSKGCRHGVNCAYQHDSSFQQRVGSIPEVQSEKRMKLEGEIAGRS